MNINPISFGKTIKVENIDQVEIITSAANGTPACCFSPVADSFVRQVKEVFDDIPFEDEEALWDERAQAYFDTQKDDTIYILSGKEAKEYNDYRREWIQANGEAYKDYGKNPSFDIEAFSKAIQEKLDKQINKLIERTKKPYSLAIENTGKSNMRLMKIIDV